MHNEFINIEGTKISKSLKNTVSLKQLIGHGYNPIAYRYWLLTGHYRTKMNFSFNALEGASKALIRLHRFFVEKLSSAKGGRVDARYASELLLALNNDLDTPKAIALLWEVVKDESLSEKAKRATMLHFDKALGLGFMNLLKQNTSVKQLPVLSSEEGVIPDHVRTLVEKREDARKEKDWVRADELRNEIKEAGFDVEDSNEGPKITPHHQSGTL
jgi:cysteinyl-tRNA synthetase